MVFISMNELNQRRATILLKNPNPLFEKWLMEWRNEARRKGSKAERTFNFALSNLKKYKLPLQSGQECKLLKGFGDKLCHMLDKKLKEHLKSASINLNPTNDDSEKTIEGNLNNIDHNVKNTLNKNKSHHKQYLPEKDSGAYVILLVLYETSLHADASCTKVEITGKAKKYSQLYVWPAMQTLLKKKLVTMSNCDSFFSLTSEGCKIAKKLWQSKNEDENLLELQNTNSIVFNIIDRGYSERKKLDYFENMFPEDTAKNTIVKLSPNLSNGKGLKRHASTASVPCQTKVQSKTLKKYATSIASSQNSAEEECSNFEPGSYDVILYIDTQETAGSSVSIKNDPLLSEIDGSDILYEVKSLKVGDYIWICRHKIFKKELVLPYIIERKRLDDFAHSIKDGRYHEQKFRLKKCGIQNITYLIENYNKHVGLPMPSLQQAVANTAIQDGFYIKFTSNIKHTAKYLVNFTKLLKTNFRSKTLVSCPKENVAVINITDDSVSLMTFKEFNQSSSKSKPMKVTDLFVKMLMQIKGMSVDKAIAVVQKYQTPSSLRKAYIENPGSRGENLLSSIQSGKLNKPLGPVLSKVVHDLFTNQTFC